MLHVSHGLNLLGGHYLEVYRSLEHGSFYRHLIKPASEDFIIVALPSAAVHEFFQLEIKVCKSVSFMMQTSSSHP